MVQIDNEVENKKERIKDMVYRMRSSKQEFRGEKIIGEERDSTLIGNGREVSWIEEKHEFAD